MNEYTLNGEHYIVFGDKILVKEDETHSFSEIESGQYYLIDGDIRLAEEPSFGSLAVFHPEYTSQKEYYRKEEFPGATPLTSIVPDGVMTCPECGGWAGAKDSGYNFCSNCGWSEDEE